MATTTRFIEATSASANDRTCAVRDTAQGSKNRTITGAIKGLFRQAVKAVTGRKDDEKPAPRRRRSGETEGEFRRLARNVSRHSDVRQSFKARAGITSRYIAIPAEAYEVATRYLASTLDMLNQWNNEADIGADFSDDFSAERNHISPHM